MYISFFFFHYALLDWSCSACTFILCHRSRFTTSGFPPYFSFTCSMFRFHSAMSRVSRYCLYIFQHSLYIDLIRSSIYAPLTPYATNKLPIFLLFRWPMQTTMVDAFLATFQCWSPVSPSISHMENFFVYATLTYFFLFIYAFSMATLVTGVFYLKGKSSWSYASAD